MSLLESVRANGVEPGVELEPISSADEAEAKKLAAELFRNIGAKGAFGMMDSTTGSFV